MLKVQQQPQEDNGISKILVAIDGSEHSMKEAELALEMSEKELRNKTKEGNRGLIALTVLDVSKPRKFLSSFIAAPTYGLRELE